MPTPVSIATGWHIATPTHGVDPRPLFEDIESVFALARMGWASLRRTLEAPSASDFEDQHFAAAGEQARAELVVTRDGADFQDTSLPVHHPPEVLEALQ